MTNFKSPEDSVACRIQRKFPTEKFVKPRFQKSLKQKLETGLNYGFLCLVIPTVFWSLARLVFGHVDRF